MEAIKDNRNSPKKYAVLIGLFVLPLVIYLLSAAGEELFDLLPVLKTGISNVEGLKDLEGNAITLDDKITVLGFFGNHPDAMKGNALNLNAKIYKRNFEFDDFQFVMFITEDAKKEAYSLTEKLAAYTSTEEWHFVPASTETITRTFSSLQTNLNLDSNLSSPYVFIIDKELRLRGRENDKDNGLMYGYNSSDIAEITNKMVDDVKVILAEYRRALKKYNSDREK